MPRRSGIPWKQWREAHQLNTFPYRETPAGYQAGPFTAVSLPKLTRLVNKPLDLFGNKFQMSGFATRRSSWVRLEWYWKGDFPLRNSYLLYRGGIGGWCLGTWQNEWAQPSPERALVAWALRQETAATESLERTLQELQLYRKVRRLGDA